MATPRTTRSAHSSPSTTAVVRGKRSSSPEKKRNRKKSKHRAYSAEAAYLRSIVTVIRAIEEFKCKLIDDSASSDVLDDFFDEISTEAAFTFDLCHAPRWLTEAVRSACEEILGAPPGHSTVFLTEIPEVGMIHGSVIVGDYTGSAVYFDDVQLGAVGLYPENCVRGSRFLRLVIVNDLRDSRDKPN